MRPAAKSGAVTALAALMLFGAAPAAARHGVFTLSGTITNGSDGGTDLIGVDYVNGQLTEHLAAGTIFGPAGSLAGQAVSFSFLYDTNAATLPVASGGVFDDQGGEWALTLDPIVTVGGVARHMILPPSGQAVFFGAAANLGLVDGPADGVTGNFSSFTWVSSLVEDITSSAFSFSAVLPASFLSTDTLLPGAVAAPHHGYASSAASGTGSFTFTHQAFVFTGASKTATATFGIDHVTFAAVPEPATWAMMLIGFGAIGAVSRRHRGAVVVAA